MEMKVYYYNPNTFEYVGSGKADIDPLETEKQQKKRLFVSGKCHVHRAGKTWRGPSLCFFQWAVGIAD